MTLFCTLLNILGFGAEFIPILLAQPLILQQVEAEVQGQLATDLVQENGGSKGGMQTPDGEAGHNTGKSGSVVAGENEADKPQNSPDNHGVNKELPGNDAALGDTQHHMQEHQANAQTHGDDKVTLGAQNDTGNPKNSYHHPDESSILFDIQIFHSLNLSFSADLVCGGLNNET